MVTREEILEFMSGPDYRPMRRRVLATALDVPKRHYQEFRELLGELEDQGHVRLGRSRCYALAGPEADGGEPGLPGTFISKGEYGFFRPDAGGEDFYVGRAHTGGAMDGDRAMLEPRRQRGPRRAGRVVRILERHLTEVVGILREGWGQPVILPDPRRADEGIAVSPPPGESPDSLPFGHKVAARITRYPTSSRGPAAEFVADLGPAGTVETETAAAIREAGLREEFPPAALAEAAALPECPPDDELRRRADYRGQRCVTIDPPDAADFDDAVCLEKTAGGWRLCVHIADVAWAVPEGGALDVEARARSTSVYLPGRVLPMLPPRISSLLCSLVPGQTRLTRSAVIDFAEDGESTGFRIERSAIRSALRLHYGQVRRALEGAPRPGEEIPAPELEQLRQMHGFSQLLRQRRFAAGAVFLDVPEVRVTVSPEGRTLAVEERVQDFSHQIVEEFMLAANRAVASFLAQAEAPALFRTHEAPDEQKLRELSMFVQGYGLAFKPPFNRRAIQRLVEAARGKPFDGAVMLAVLTSMKQARYSAADGEHFALAFRPYCHFTSPIRRYPDLVVHRALERLCPPGEYRLESAGSGGGRGGRRARIADRREAGLRMAMLATHCSRMERAAADAERRVTRVRQLDLLQREKAGEHGATITGVTEFGLFARLDRFLVEGLVHVTSMTDRYRFQAGRRELVGQRTGQRWRLGDRVTVRILRMDPSADRLDLELV